MRVPRYVEVETSRYCNRLCEWCPNHPLGDRKEQELLPWPALERIVQSLARAEYGGWFAFHNYNEPLANPRIVEELSFVRAALPLARPTIYTNGDRLTSGLYGALMRAGLVQMRVTIYPEKRKAQVPSHTALRRWLRRRPFLAELSWDEVDVRQGAALLHTGSPEIILISPRVEGYYDRGGTIPWLSMEMRTAPCLLTSNSLSIDYRGNIKMCCNVVTGSAAHQEYLLGNVPEDDVLEVWNSKAFESVRARHARSDWDKTPICRTCKQELKQVSHGA